MSLVSPQAARFLAYEFFLCQSSIPSLNKYCSFLFDLLVSSLRLDSDQSQYFSCAQDRLSSSSFSCYLKKSRCYCRIMNSLK